MNFERRKYENKSRNKNNNCNIRSNLERSSSQTSINKNQELTIQYDRRHCPYQLLCKEFISSLSWPEIYFNNLYDRCYCFRCYSENKSDAYLIANSPYVIPRGWVRFGIHVDNVKAQVEDIWKKWHNTYHGTDIHSALSIIKHGQFLLKGDTFENGDQLNCRCPYLYTSPTIKYSARNAYAKPNRFVTSNGECFIAKIVLQCKQKPGTYNIQGATGNARREKKICNIISNDKIEYYTDIRASVIPYGVMVQLTAVDT
ncbi:unnamed protein product [Rotaria sp. Silwood1]|nr:unnamed protein product [Rotaria sp. Silwood1]CAF1681224.1 unnamed protein product [Rotaria sp. Silwood1]CAF3520226.1 unnamed protein product [Rotaria sp. Silwood1]CAF3588680.1 unnamed protein product [Rotaria sp. Silwood1]CAF3866490.1 unnamed protein product [Rotaria sp. Silwood1]